MPTVRLFVYGSLKRGGIHHEELAGAPFVGEAWTSGDYALEPVGECYLGLVEQPGTAHVPGELYAVTAEQLRRLDELEGDDYRLGWVVLSPSPRARDAVSQQSAENGFALAYLKRTR